MKYKKNKAILAGLSAVVAACGYLAFGNQALKADATIPYVQEAQYTLVSNHGSMETYENLVEMYKKSALVLEVQIKSQETIDLSIASVATRSVAKVLNTYKGDSSLQQVTITEMGGIKDTSKVIGNETRVDPSNMPEKHGMVEVAIDGSTVMKSNQKYLVFLIQNPDSQWGYNVTGVVQGKIKVMEDEKMVATVDPSVIAESDLFFLQKNFAGKTKQELLKQIERIKK